MSKNNMVNINIDSVILIILNIVYVINTKFKYQISIYVYILIFVNFLQLSNCVSKCIKEKFSKTLSCYLNFLTI